MSISPLQAWVYSPEPLDYWYLLDTGEMLFIYHEGKWMEHPFTVAENRVAWAQTVVDVIRAEREKSRD